MYFLSLNKIIENRNITDADSEKEIDFLVKVELAYSSLSDEGKKFINSEFFLDNYRGWWKGYYSKSQFYKLKKKYSIEFIRKLSIYVF